MRQVLAAARMLRTPRSNVGSRKASCTEAVHCLEPPCYFCFPFANGISWFEELRFWLFLAYEPPFVHPYYTTLKIHENGPFCPSPFLAGIIKGNVYLLNPGFNQTRDVLKQNCLKMSKNMSNAPMSNPPKKCIKIAMVHVGFPNKNGFRGAILMPCWRRDNGKPSRPSICCLSPPSCESWSRRRPPWLGVQRPWTCIQGSRGSKRYEMDWNGIIKREGNCLILGRIDIITLLKSLLVFMQVIPLWWLLRQKAPWDSRNLLRLGSSGIGAATLGRCLRCGGWCGALHMPRGRCPQWLHCKWDVRALFFILAGPYTLWKEAKFQYRSTNKSYFKGFQRKCMEGMSKTSTTDNGPPCWDLFRLVMPAAVLISKDQKERWARCASNPTIWAYSVTSMPSCPKDSQGEGARGPHSDVNRNQTP